MNVLILTNHLKPGGISSYCLILCRGMKEYGVNVSVVSGGGPWEARLREYGISHFRFPLDTSAEMNPMSLFSFFGIRRLVKDLKIDIIHDQTRVTQVLGGLVSKSAGIKRVSTCHGVLRKRMLRKMFPLWGERVIAISDNVKDHLKREWHLDPRRISLISHGIQVSERNEAASIDRDKFRRKWNIPKDALLIGALGRYSPVKGFDVLIDAMARLAKDPLNSFVLCLVGEGPEKRRLSEGIMNRKLLNRVKLIPTCDNNSAYFNALDVFCAPSRAEGFGLSILEAMAHCVPVIASRVGAIPDLLEDGKNGILVDADDADGFAKAIKVLRDNRGKAQEMALIARESVRSRFPVEQMVMKTAALYSEVVNL